ncbi:acetyl-CoA C-acyltransferase [Rubellimicrobium roseum]|uniref:Acetyl-CoA C-acyltransferase n=1 Tax=Rubellimicrobium roseum TaxID=687525 RepID=A0A5C4NDL3_9RHOB|nr:acetyl-CoA C-acyltransferase [Rubellimicrobium roseum]TNC72015.1 acetyl-CoA C-acyltransferase [Rubellimicrobium roseum]
MADPVVIAGAARTPLGAYQGELSMLPATRLGSLAIAAALDRAGLTPDRVDEVLMGCVLPAGLGQAPARQAALGAGLPTAVPCTIVNKVCGSGMKAVMLAHDAILSGASEIVVAGGMESMSNAPYLLPKARGGYRIGHGQVLDHMMLDGLEDAYDLRPDGTRRSMGTFGEDCAARYQLTREAQDGYATASIARAREATGRGAFAWEIVPVEAKGEPIITDEGPRRIKPEKIPTLKPAFAPDGTITAASSSSINDGAAALVLLRQSRAESEGVQPLARIIGQATFAGEPGWFTTAPIHAIRRLCDRLGWRPGDVDLYEINEAFAVVPMAAMQELGLPHDRVNVQGGACALGHPIGASGARILVTLLGALRERDLDRGIAAICIGGGEAMAVAVERLR